MKPEIIVYKNHEIHIVPNGDYYSCLIYKNSKPTKGTFDKSKDTAIKKAKDKIDSN